MDISVPMFEKGRSFIMAAGLVKAHAGHRFVYLHLLCQGIECVGKALLLTRDYAKYEPILRTKYGHNIEHLIAEIDQITGAAFFSESAGNELSELNRYYKRQLLRYGNSGDFEKQANGLNADHLHREVVDRLGELNHKFSYSGEK